VIKRILKISAVLVVPVFLLFAFACGHSDDPAGGAESRTGISPDAIRIGSSLALEGHAGYLGTQTLHGALSYIKKVNENGGVFGRKLELIAMDDGYDPPRCVYNTQKLILEEKVFSLFCYVGTPTTVRIVPLVTQAEIPLVGMFTGASRLRKPVNPYLINVRTSYYRETEAAVDYMVNELEIERLAVFYQYDEYGFDGLRGAEIALQKYGLKPVAKGSYVRGTDHVAPGLEKIIASDAEAVVMIGTYGACSKFIRLSEKRGFSPVFHAVSFVGSEELLRRLGSLGEGVLITQVMPSPQTETPKDTLPAVQEYADLLGRYFPGSTPNYVGLEGFINAKVLVEGLKRAGPDITREKFVRAIESMKAYDPGIANPLSFGYKDHQGLDRVYFTKIINGEIRQIQ